MVDCFAIYGDEIHLGPYKVGALDPRIPATVRARVEQLASFDEEQAEEDIKDAVELGARRIEEEIKSELDSLLDEGELTPELHRLLKKRLT